MKLSKEDQALIEKLWHDHSYLREDGTDTMFYEAFFEVASDLILKKNEERDRVREEERDRISFSITQVPRVSGINAIPETDEYANGWNDCRKKARENVVTLLQYIYKLAATPPSDQPINN